MQLLDTNLQKAQQDQEVWQAKRNKGDMVREWDALPLRSASDLDAWFRSKMQGPPNETTIPSRSIGLFSSSNMSASPDLAEPLRWTEDPEQTSIADNDFGASPAGQFQVLPLIMETGEETRTGTPDSGEQSKTSALLRRQDNLYF